MPSLRRTIARRLASASVNAVSIALIAGLEAAVAAAAAIYSLGYVLLGLENSSAVLGVEGAIACALGVYAGLVLGRIAYRNECALARAKILPGG